MLRVKTIVVPDLKDTEPFDTQLQKAIQGLKVKDIKYSFTLSGLVHVQSALILYDA